MANPVVDIRDTGRNSARTGDVRELSDNVITSATSVTTGTIAVTADATYDVSFTQPADTSIKNLIMIANGNLVTAGADGDDIDFDLGTAAGGGQIIDEKAIEVCTHCDSLIFDGNNWILFSMGNTTSINELTFNRVNDGKIYDMLGRELTEIPVGKLYIRNQKLYITR